MIYQRDVRVGWMGGIGEARHLVWLSRGGNLPWIVLVQGWLQIRLEWCYANQFCRFACIGKRDLQKGQHGNRIGIGGFSKGQRLGDGACI
jgi:hypothetical protein